MIRAYLAASTVTPPPDLSEPRSTTKTTTLPRPRWSAGTMQSQNQNPFNSAHSGKAHKCQYESLIRNSQDEPTTGTFVPNLPKVFSAIAFISNSQHHETFPATHKRLGPNQQALRTPGTNAPLCPRPPLSRTGTIFLNASASWSLKPPPPAMDGY